MQQFDFSYFRGKSHSTSNYLCFHPVHRYFKKIGNSVHIFTRKFKGFSDKSIELPATSDNSL